MKKKGYTLIEVLSVIVIIGIIALITVPIVLNVNKKADKKTFETSVNQVAKGIDKYLVKNSLKQLPECDSDQILIREFDLKNKNVFSEDSYVCYDPNQKCNYIYAESSKHTKNLFSGCIDTIPEDKSDSDSTPPKYSELVFTTTTNQIIMHINWFDNESGIDDSSIRYSIKKHDSNKWSEWQTSNIFNKLQNATEYDVRSKVTSLSGNVMYVKKSATTKDIPIPIYSGYDSSWKTQKSVTITYGDGFENSYSLDEGNTWIDVNGNSVTVNFEQAGTIIGKSYDGVNSKTAIKLTVEKIDNVTPTCTLTAAGTEGENNWYKSNVTITAKATTTGGSTPKVTLKKGNTTIGSSTTVTDTLNSNTTGVTYSAVAVSESGLTANCTDLTVKRDASGNPTAVSITGKKENTNTSVKNNDWVNSNVTLTATPNPSTSPTSGYTYQWYKGGTDVSNEIPGATSSTYTAKETNKYYVIVKSGAGVPAQANFQVNIDTSGDPKSVSITGKKKNTTTSVTRGTWVSTDVTLTATPNPSTAPASGYTYQWYKGGTADSNKLTDATSSTYTATTTGKYYVIVKSGAGKTAQDNFQVNIDKVTPTCSLTASGTKGDNNWYKSNVTITATATTTGGSTPTIKLKKGDETTVSDITVSDELKSDTTGITYSAEAESESGLTKNCTNLTVKRDASGNPTSVSITGTRESGTWGTTNVTLTANPTAASTTSGYTYQWYKYNSDPYASETLSIISGATGKTYTATTTDAYVVIVKSGAGKTATSYPYSVKIDKSGNPKSVSITGKKKNTDISVTSGAWVSTDVTLTATPSPSTAPASGYTYQWYKGGTDVSNKLTDATSSTYTATTTGKYYVIVKSGAGVPAQDNFQVNIDKSGNPTSVSITGTRESRTWGTTNVTLTANPTAASTTSGYTYQWYKYNSDPYASETLSIISGATGKTYTASTTDDYVVKVKSGVGKTATSNVYSVYIDKASPTASLSANRYTDRIQLTASCSSSSGISKYEFKRDSGNWVDNGTNKTYLDIGLTQNQSHTYYVRCTNGAGTSTTSSGYSFKTQTIQEPTTEIVDTTTCSGCTWYSPSLKRNINYNNANIYSGAENYFIKSEAQIGLGTSVSVMDCGENGPTNYLSSQDTFAGYIKACNANPKTISNLEANRWYKVNQKTRLLVISQKTDIYYLTCDTLNCSGMPTTTNLVVPPNINYYSTDGIIYHLDAYFNKGKPKNNANATNNYSLTETFWHDFSTGESYVKNGTSWVTNPYSSNSPAMYFRGEAGNDVADNVDLKANTKFISKLDGSKDLTIEIVYKPNTTDGLLISNLEKSGFGFYATPKVSVSHLLGSNDYDTVDINPETNTNTTHYSSFVSKYEPKTKNRSEIIYLDMETNNKKTNYATYYNKDIALSTNSNLHLRLGCNSSTRTDAVNGCEPSPYNYENYKGYISAVRIYKTSLSELDIHKHNFIDRKRYGF